MPIFRIKADIPDSETGEAVRLSFVMEAKDEAALDKKLRSYATGYSELHNVEITRVASSHEEPNC